MGRFSDMTAKRSVKRAADAARAEWEALFSYHFYTLCVAMYKWGGVDTIDYAYLESILYSDGCCVVYRDPVAGFLRASAAIPTGYRNIYNLPTTFNTISYGCEQSHTLTLTECVPVYANYARVGLRTIIQPYITALADFKSAERATLSRAKIPKIFACDEETRIDAIEIMRAADRGEPFIAVYNSLMGKVNIDSIDVSNKDTYTLTDILADQNKELNQAYTIIGINNANDEKRERLITSEVEANNSAIYSAMDSGLVMRMQACKQIKDMFDEDISVKLANESELQTMMTATLFTGDENEND